MKAAIEDVAKLCADLGHEVIPAKNTIDGNAFEDAFLAAWASGPAELVALVKQMGLEPDAVLEPWTLGLADLYNSKPKGTLENALAHFEKITAETVSFMKDYDVWLTPVLATTPPRTGEQAPTVPFDTLYERVFNYVTYTPLHNVVGTPAMSVPLLHGAPQAFPSARSSPLRRGRSGCYSNSPSNSSRPVRGRTGIRRFLQGSH